MKCRAFFLLLVVALVAGGCGGGDDGGDDVLGLGDRDLDRCSLITAEEAEAVIGALESPPAPSEGIDGNPDPVTCLYQAADSPNSFLVQVYDGAVFFAEEGSGARDGPTIEGLGDDAFMSDGAVRFLQNDWAASVARISGNFPDEELLTLAELMSSRLP